MFSKEAWLSLVSGLGLIDKLESKMISALVKLGMALVLIFFYFKKSIKDTVSEV